MYENEEDESAVYGLLTLSMLRLLALGGSA